jgi:hypothetical protein
LVNETYLTAGNQKTVTFLDKLKNLGFDAATKAGISIAISDILIPDKKHDIIDEAQKEVDDIQDKFKRHVLTDGERYNKVIDIWTHATNNIAAAMMNGMESNDQGFNPVYMMADSGARGSQDQIKQGHDEGRTAADIAIDLRVNPTTVRNRANRMNPPLKFPRTGGPGLKRVSHLRDPSKMRTRHTGIQGNVGGAHQTQLPTVGGIPGKVNTNTPGPRGGKGH